MDSDKLPFSETDTDESESLLLKLVSGCSGKVEGRTKLMKLVFFSEYYNPNTDSLQSEERMGIFDDFIIYNHGPFSRDVMNIFDTLKEHGLIEEDTELTFSGNRKKIIRLTKKGREKIEENDLSQESIEQVIFKFGDKKATNLEKDSLSMLGISRSEKENHRYDPVSELISPR